MAENENVAIRRKVYVQREIAKAVVEFPKSDEITRKVSSVAIRAVEMFNRHEYATDEVAQFFEEGQAEPTMQAIYYELLSAGVTEGQKWCDTKHEQPKSCDCAELFKVLLGLTPAVAPLPEVESE